MVQPMQTIRALLVLTAVALSAAPVQAQDKPFSAFFGEYEGSSISSTEQGLSKRDLSVSIQPKGNGFTLKWTTITHKADGKAKRKSYSIDFRPSGRANIFASAMRRNKFGASIPLRSAEGRALRLGPHPRIDADRPCHDGHRRWRLRDASL
jgi:hypothetical protein